MRWPEMDALLHRMRTDPKLAALIGRAEGEALDDFERANLREMRRDWRSSNAVPEALVEAKSLATSRCEHAWQTQRPLHDWAGFLDNFRPVLRLAREEARYLADDSGLAPYDALLDQYEPGMTGAEVDRLFGDLQAWLPDLVRRVRERQAGEKVERPAGPFPKAQQRALSLEVMKLLGFDFDAGRLDESAHPFSGGVPEDTRLTTRYREDDFLQSLMGTIHETGHARYEQNLPREWLGQPIAQAALDGHPRKPEPVVRDAARPRSGVRRPDRPPPRRGFRRLGGVRADQPASAADARRTRLDPRRRR